MNTSKIISLEKKLDGNSIELKHHGGVERKNSKKGTLSYSNLMKRIEESGKSELLISCSKVKMVLFEDFAFVQERFT